MKILEKNLKLLHKVLNLKQIKNIGKKMENAVSAFFENKENKILQKILGGIIY